MGDEPLEVLGPSRGEEVAEAEVSGEPGVESEKEEGNAYPARREVPLLSPTERDDTPPTIVGCAHATNLLRRSALMPSRRSTKRMRA